MRTRGHGNQEAANCLAIPILSDGHYLDVAGLLCRPQPAHMTSHADHYLGPIIAASRAAVDGDTHAARSCLAPIAGEVWERVPPWKPPAARIGEKLTGGPRQSFSKSRAANAFSRDRFQCRYCGQRLVPVCLLSVLSSIFPNELPYVSTYKRGSTHVVYWLIGAEADHIVPGTRGGDWIDPANHAAACVLCNTRKADWTLDELGWSLRPIQHLDWDGLVPVYHALWELAGQPNPRYHNAWIRALESASAA
jgi:5-methylcytosine-specific restriction endonuclease McrA